MKKSIKCSLRIGILVNQVCFLRNLFNTDADGSCKVDEQAVCQLRDLLEFFNNPNCSIYTVQYCIFTIKHDIQQVL